VFIRVTNTKHWEVPKIAGRTTKVKFFQKGSAGFKATIDPNKNEHQADVSFYVMDVDIISLRQKLNYMEHEGKTIETERRKFLLDALKLIVISGRDRVPNYRGIFQLEPD
jgi:CCR4-NOT transcriptional regulation complex NOT5 subunit